MYVIVYICHAIWYKAAMLPLVMCVKNNKCVVIGMQFSISWQYCYVVELSIKLMQCALVCMDIVSLL